MKNEDKIVDLLVDMLAENRLIVSEVRLTNTKLDKLTERVDVISEKVDTLTGRVDKLTDRVDTLNDRVFSLEQKFDKQSETLVETLAEQIAMKNQLSQLNDRVGEALDTFFRAVDNKKEVAEKFKIIEQRLDSLERKDKTA